MAAGHVLAHDNSFCLPCLLPATATLAPAPQLGIARKSIADISRHDVNIVHVQRQLLPATEEALQAASQALIRHQRKHQHTYRVQASLPVQEPEVAAEVAEQLVSQLLPSLQGTQAGTWLLQDICTLAAQFEEAVPFNPDTGEHHALQHLPCGLITP